MIYGLEKDEKRFKQKKRGFWWKFKDMFDNKNAVQSDWNRAGTQTENEEKFKVNK
jgi:hypothetical protein